MSAINIINKARESGVFLYVNEGRLAFKSQGELSSALKAEIIMHRDEIIALLVNYQRSAQAMAAGAPVMKHRTIQEKRPVTFEQQRMLVLDTISAHKQSYNMAALITLSGPLDRAALERAINTLVERHEVLRTHYRFDEQGYYGVLHAHAEIALAIDDLTSLPAPQREARLAALAQESAEQAFDLAGDSPLRVKLVSVGEREHRLLITLHHIAFDNVSMAIFCQQLSTAYNHAVNADEAPLAALPLQYADYADFQLAQLNMHHDRLKHFWYEHLHGLPVLHDLPLDYVRPATLSAAGKCYRERLPAERGRQVSALAEKSQTTVFAVLQSIFAVFLHRYGGAEDIVVGTPVNNRTNSELEALIGLFVNTLVIRSEIHSDDTFEQFLANNSAMIQQSLAHALYPLEQLVETMKVERSLSHNPLFQIVFVYQDERHELLHLHDLQCRIEELHTNTAKFDIVLTLSHHHDGLSLNWEYSTDLFDATSIANMSRSFIRVLESLCRHPEQTIGAIALLDASEAAANIAAADAARQCYTPELTLDRLFDRQAERYPQKIALELGEHALGYASLKTAAEHLAQRIVDAGIRPQSRIAIVADPSFEMIIAILAVLKAGCAYIPIDPASPAARIRYIAQDAAADAVLVTEQTQALAPAECGHCLRITCEHEPTSAAAFTPATITPDDPAYVIYTSGSTGKPKGVEITHGNVARLFDATERQFGFRSQDVWTLFHSFAFDFSVWEIWGALLFGGKLVLVPREVSRDPDAFYDLVARRGVTVLNQTPTAFNPFIAADGRQPRPLALRYVIFGGEALNLMSLRPWLQRHGDRQPQLINMYGITETTVHVTYKPLTCEEIASGRGSLIGKPLDDLSLYLLDASLQPVPDGVVAELFVAGGGLARGYLNRPEITAERFIPNPFNPQERLYRTGDLACRLPSGEFRYHGRCDQQVKIRGFRIETGEIECALLQHPQVREAVVMVYEPEEHGPQLVAYVVEESGVSHSQLQQALRQHLSATLAEYMIPSLFIATPDIPLTINGKVARHLLAKPDFSALFESSFVAPDTWLQQQMCEIWQRTLNVSRVGIDDNFFALGGDSIRVIGMVAAAKDAGIALSAKDVFAHQTIARLSAHLEQQQRQTVEDVRPAPFALLSARERAVLDGLPMTGTLQDAYPLTQLQKGMVFHNQRDGDKATYHDIMGLQLSITWHQPTFLAALRVLVEQHDILRTRFVLHGDAMLQVVETDAEPELECFDLRGMAAAQAQQAIDAWMEGEKGRAFDDDGRLWKVTVHVLNDDEINYTLTCHHAIMDGWSVASFNSALFKQYRSALLQQPCAVAQGLPYSRYVASEMSAARSVAAKDYWQRTLDGATLPWWHRSERGRILLQPVAIDEEVNAALIKLARQLQVPESTLFLTAHLFMLAFLNGKKEVVTSMVTHQRPAVAGGDSALGLFLNSVPLRMTLNAGTPWRQLINDVRQQLAAMAEYSDYPLANIQKDTSLDFSSSLFNFTHFHTYNALTDSIKLVKEQSFTETNYAFASQFSRNVTTQRYELLLELDSAVFDPAFSQHIARYYVILLRQMVLQPGQAADYYAILGDDACLRLRQQVQRPIERFHPGLCIHELFEARAASHPEKVALTFADETLTYRQLNQRANQLACWLVEQGVEADSLVGLCLERSLDMVIAIYGILKAGAAYVPLDPEAPAQRLQTMIAAAGISQVITSADVAPTLNLARHEHLIIDDADTVLMLQRYCADNIDKASLRLTPQHLAYVIHTSGSTGTPKGVMVEHAALVNRIGWMNKAYPLGGDDVILQKTPFGFDVSVWEFLWPLTHGASLVIAKPHGHKDPYYLADLIVSRGVTIMHFVPSMLRAFLSIDECRGCTALRHVICSGEALSVDVVEAFHHTLPTTRLHNLYGPTEAAIDVTYWDTRDRTQARTVPIGYPIDNLRIYILNDEKKPMPQGCPGELYIGGVGLARGYRHRDDLTREKFCQIDDPLFNGERVYQSGDLAVYHPQGEIEYLGRIDDQVKIKGFRIELQEIEQQIAGFQPGAHGIVLVRTQHHDKQLVAYVAGVRDVDALRAFLCTRLNDYMIPAHFVVLASIPLSVNGKVDRKALAAIVIDDMAAAEFVGASTPMEQALAQVFARVLEAPRISMRDNFFALGGDSIRSIALVAECRARGMHMSIQDVYKYPQVDRLAEYLASRQQMHDDAVLVGPTALLSDEDRRRLPDDIQEAYPLTTLQKGLVLESQLAAGSAVYHDIVVYTVDDTLDYAAFSQALSEVQQRHSILRTCFDWSTFSEPLQIVRAGQCNGLTWVDVTALSPSQQQQALDDFLAQEKRHEFDWTAPLIRYFIHQISTTRYQFTLSFHDSMLDGWSINALSSEIFDRYFARRQGQPLAEKYRLPVLPYRQYVALEMAALPRQQDRDYWRDKLADFTFTSLPFTGAGTDHTIRYAEVEFAPEVSHGLLNLAAQMGVPVKVVLLAAHMRVLAFISGQYHVVSGLEQNGRPEMADAERTLGLFLNTLPFRLELLPGTWKDLVRQVFEEEIALMPYRHYPMAQMRLDNGIGNLFEVVFNYVHFHVSQDTMARHSQALAQLDSVLETEYPLRAEFSRDTQHGQVALSLHYNPSRIGHDEVDIIRHYYQQVLGALATDSDADWLDLSLLTAEQHDNIMHRWNDTHYTLPSTMSIHQLLEQQASATPDRIAVIEGPRQRSYRQLSDDANRIAGALQQQGVKPGDVVALYAERSIDFLTVMLGIFNAGAVYLPLDVNHPGERIRTILAQCDSRMVIAESNHVASLSAIAAGSPSFPEMLTIADLQSHASTALPPAVRYDLNDVAYIIFTSGSTGTPKGAMVEHIGLINHVYAKMRDLSLTSADIVAQNASQCFDISIWQFLSPLAFGGCVCICPDEVSLDARRLIATVAAQGITILELVPSLLKEVINQLEDAPEIRGQLARLRWLVPTGEALPPQLARQWLALFPQVPILNAYGPTECSDDITHYPIVTPPAADVVNMPIGRPVVNMRMYILDSRRKRVPVGTVGELYVSGIGVGPGYINNPQKTAEAFIDNLFDDGYSRLYRTGDLARYQKDGTIEFLGRVDHQVKIRGFRIELGEIEASLRHYPYLNEVVIAVVENNRHDRQLVAYVSLKHRSEAELAAEYTAIVNALTALLTANLPQYMVPAHIVLLTALPHLSNGKIDRKSLPDYRLHMPAVALAAPPTTPLEHQIAALWQDHLTIESISMDDNFFNVGGHSLMAMRLVSDMNKTLGMNAGVRELFMHPTPDYWARKAELQRELACNSETATDNGDDDSGIEMEF